jgi:hypothetical protein
MTSNNNFNKISTTITISPSIRLYLAEFCTNIAQISAAVITNVTIIRVRRVLPKLAFNLYPAKYTYASREKVELKSERVRDPIIDTIKMISKMSKQ